MPNDYLDSVRVYPRTLYDFQWLDKEIRKTINSARNREQLDYSFVREYSRRVFEIWSHIARCQGISYYEMLRQSRNIVYLNDHLLEPSWEDKFVDLQKWFQERRNEWDKKHFLTA